MSTPMTTHTPRCIARHSGVWMAEPAWFRTTWAAVRSGTFRMMDDDEAEDRSKPVASVTEDGIGLIDMTGPIMKGASKFGNVDSVKVRGAVRTMMADPAVKGIVVRVDSPGGTFAGTDALYQDVRAAAKVKPVFAQVEDLAASAAYYAVAGASGIFSDGASQTGSIGTYAVVEDSSAASELAGIKVYVVSSGDMKGAFADGAPITPEQLAYLTEHVQQANGFFLNAVKKGRGMTDKRLAAVANGRTWFAEEAMSLGLVDGVQTLDATVEHMRKEIATRAKAAQNQRRMETARLRG